VTDPDHPDVDEPDDEKRELDHLVEGELKALAYEAALRRKPRAVPIPLTDFLR
jgi:hypothetical protein